MYQILQMEQTNVLDVYNNIAYHFDQTRHTVWKNVGEFIDLAPSASTIADIGCGNGKNMLTRKDCTFIGCDNCSKFIEICKNKNLNVVLGNATNVPFGDNSFDRVMSIAVIHHLVTRSRRMKAIHELVRICKIGGQLMIQVWSIDANIKPDRIKDVEDGKLIQWRHKNTVYDRFYHMFEEDELKCMIDEIDGVEIIDMSYVYGNWICIIRKIDI